MGNKFISSMMEIVPTSFGDVEMESAIEPTELRLTGEFQIKCTILKGIYLLNLLYRM